MQEDPHLFRRRAFLVQKGDQMVPRPQCIAFDTFDFSVGTQLHLSGKLSETEKFPQGSAFCSSRKTLFFQHCFAELFSLFFANILQGKNFRRTASGSGEKFEIINGQRRFIHNGARIAVAFIFEGVFEKSDGAFPLAVGVSVDPVGNVEGDTFREPQMSVDPFNGVIAFQHFRHAEIVVAVVKRIGDPQVAGSDEGEDPGNFREGQSVGEQFTHAVHAVNIGLERPHAYHRHCCGDTFIHCRQPHGLVAAP